MFITLFTTCSRVVDDFRFVDNKGVFNSPSTSYEHPFLSRSDARPMNISTETEEEEYFLHTYIDSLRRGREIGDILARDVRP